MLEGPVSPKPIPTHIHCNFKLHFNNDRFIKDTHYFFLVTHITLLMPEQAVFFFYNIFHIFLIVLWENGFFLNTITIY